MNSHVVVSIFHLALVVPLFLYVAFSRAATPEWVYWLVFGLGLLLVVYQGTKAAYRYIAGSTYLWVNLFHLFLIAPLLVYIGYNGKKTPRPAYELLAIAGFGALGYHLYNILLQIQIIQDE
jgi:hypothetical protein